MSLWVSVFRFDRAGSFGPQYFIPTGFGGDVQTDSKTPTAGSVPNGSASAYMAVLQPDELPGSTVSATLYCATSSFFSPSATVTLAAGTFDDGVVPTTSDSTSASVTVPIVAGDPQVQTFSLGSLDLATGEPNALYLWGSASGISFFGIMLT